MKKLEFTAKLLSDCVISEYSATEGGHSALDYIPGACFLGWAASKLYKGLGYIRAFDVFHSGKVRFGNAYPMDKNCVPCAPIPMCWRRYKGEDYEDKGRIIQGSLFNSIWDKKDDGKQDKPIREGYFSDNFSIINPATHYLVKTAIDRKTGGRAAEAQMFGYEGIKAGTRFHFSIEIDDDTPEEIIDRLTKVFAGRTIYVGRSRSAEYGVLKVELASGVARNELPSFVGKVVYVYCYSDLALADITTGVSTMTPCAAHFELPKDMKFDPSESYIRARTYTPFNGHRGRHEMERHVIVKGGVIAFSSDRQINEKELAAAWQVIAGGVGMYLHDGLGKVMINPHFIGKDYLSRTPKGRDERAPKKEAPKPLHALVTWLDEKHAEADEDRKVEQLMLDNEIDELVEKIISKGGPSKSQWSHLRQIAMDSKDIDDIKAGLKVLSDGGVSRRQWVREDYNYYEDFLLKEIVNGKEFSFVRKALFRLGAIIPHKINQRGDK